MSDNPKVKRKRMERLLQSRDEEEKKRVRNERKDAASSTRRQMINKVEAYSYLAQFWKSPTRLCTRLLIDNRLLIITHHRPSGGCRKPSGQRYVLIMLPPIEYIPVLTML